MIFLVAEMAMKKFWFRYYCFSLFKADIVNRILLWTLLPFSLVAYYYSSRQKLNSSLPIDEAIKDLSSRQWYIYFNKKEFFILLMAIVLYNQFKGTRDAAITTSILVACIYNSIAELLGLHDKYAYIDIVWLCLMYGLLAHSIFRYFNNARKRRNI